MKDTRKSISTRGKIAMLIIVIVGGIYWLMGKVEVWISSLHEKQRNEEEL